MNAEDIDTAPLDVSGVLSSEMTERSSFGRMDVVLAKCRVFERSPPEAPDLTERSFRCCCSREAAALEKCRCWGGTGPVGGTTSESLKRKRKAAF